MELIARIFSADAISCGTTLRPIGKGVRSSARRFKHGRIAAYSIPNDDGTTTYGLIFTHLGKSNQEERDRPYIADEIVAKAEATAPNLAAMASPAWTGEIGWKPATISPDVGES